MIEPVDTFKSISQSFNRASKDPVLGRYDINCINQKPPLRLLVHNLNEHNFHITLITR